MIRFLLKISFMIVSLLDPVFSNYTENIEFIKEHNTQNTSYEVGINEFINHSYVNGKNNQSLSYIKTTTDHLNIFTDLTIPKEINWTKKGYVSSVKNQLQCGSCWAFSASEAIEGEWGLKHHQMYNLSEQELVDCSGYLGNNGCGGGTMKMGFEYVIENGLCLNQSYPYNGTEGICQNQTCTKKVHIDKYHSVAKDNIKQLEKAVSKQPISIAIQANLRSFQLYKKGIYSDPMCGSELDHGVLLVGYGHDSHYGMDYWIVKNSWDESWGENGYIRILKDSNQTGGECGILMDASYPVITIKNKYRV